MLPINGLRVRVAMKGKDGVEAAAPGVLEFVVEALFDDDVAAGGTLGESLELAECNGGMLENRRPVDSPKLLFSSP